MGAFFCPGKLRIWGMGDLRKLFICVWSDKQNASSCGAAQGDHNTILYSFIAL